MKAIRILLTLFLVVPAFGQKEALQRAVGTNTVTGSLSSAPFQVATIAALKAIVPSSNTTPNGTQVYVTGYAIASDGGEGYFIYNSSSAATSNGGTIFAPNSGSGRWLRVIEGSAIYAKWFNVKANGTDDDTAALQAAIDCGESSALPVMLPAGVILISGKISFVSSSVRISGAGMMNTTVRSNDETEAIFEFSGTCNSFRIEDMLIEYSGASDGSQRPAVSTAVGLLFASGDHLNWSIYRCKIRNTYDAIRQEVGAVMWSFECSQIELSQFYHSGLIRRDGTQGKWNRMTITNSNESNLVPLSATGNAIYTNTTAGDTFVNLNLETLTMQRMVIIDESGLTSGMTSFLGLHIEGFVSIGGSEFFQLRGKNILIDGVNISRIDSSFGSLFIFNFETNGQGVPKSLLVNALCFRSVTAGAANVRIFRNFRCWNANITINNPVEVADLTGADTDWNAYSDTYSGPRRLELKEEFYAVQSPDLTTPAFSNTWTVTATGTGSAGRPTPLLDTELGAVALNTGTVGNDGVLIQQPTIGWNPDTKCLVRGRFRARFTANQTGADGSVSRIGFYNNATLTAAPTRGFGFIFDPTVSANWYLETFDGAGTRQVADTGISAASSSTPVLVITSTADGYVSCYQDNSTSIGSVGLTLAVPLNNVSDALKITILAYKGAGATGKTLVVDYARAYRHLKF